MADISNSKLFQQDKGIGELADAFIVVVKTEWNAAIVDELENGCLAAMHKQGIQNIRTITVPGAVEIPFAIKSLWDNADPAYPPAAFIALGCVVRGDTPHFEYVCKAVTEGVTQLNLLLPVPTIFGVLTVNTEEQAQERIGGKHGHKGEEAAITALKMIALKKGFTK